MVPMGQDAEEDHSQEPKGKYQISNPYCRLPKMLVAKGPNATTGTGCGGELQPKI